LLLFLCSLPRSVKKALEPLANTRKALEGSMGRKGKTFSSLPTKSLTLQWFSFFWVRGKTTEQTLEEIYDNEPTTLSAHNINNK